MAIVTGINSAVTTVGAREDLTNTITMISPDETPLFTNSTKIKASAITHEWQTDTLDASTTNSFVEGGSVTTSTANATTRLSNILQISLKSYGVSGTLQNLNLAGREDELLRLRMKKGLELRRDMEVVLHTNQAKVAATGDATVRKLGGLPTYISNVVGDGYALTSANGSSAVSGSSTTALAYEYYASAMQMAFEDGGQPDMVEVPPTLKRKFSLLAFGTAPSTAQVRYNMDTAGQAIAVGAVEKWQTDFGLVDVMVNRQFAIQGVTFLKQASFFLDTKHLSVAQLRSFEVTKKGKVGDATEEFILSEYTLENRAPDAHAGVYGMT